MNKTPLLLVGAMALSGCGHIIGHLISSVKGSGHVDTDTRKVGTFTKVRAEGSMDIDVKIGPASDVKVTGDDNILPLIKTSVEGDTLVVKTEQNYSTHRKVKVEFTVPKLEGAALAGSGDIQVSNLQGGDFAASVAGSGNIKGTGSVDNLSVSISGSGDATLADLAAKSASVQINGSGDAAVDTSGDLTVSINGSGDVRYSGNPSKITKSINGSGSIKAK